MSSNNPIIESNVGPAAFQSKYLVRDLQAGVITGAMAIPLTVGIAMMSDYGPDGKHLIICDNIQNIQ